MLSRLSGRGLITSYSKVNYIYYELKHAVMNKTGRIFDILGSNYQYILTIIKQIKLKRAHKAICSKKSLHLDIFVEFSSKVYFSLTYYMFLVRAQIDWPPGCSKTRFCIMLSVKAADMVDV